MCPRGEDSRGDSVAVIYGAVVSSQGSLSNSTYVAFPLPKLSE